MRKWNQLSIAVDNLASCQKLQILQFGVAKLSLCVGIRARFQPRYSPLMAVRRIDALPIQDVFMIYIYWFLGSNSIILLLSGKEFQIIQS